MTILTCICNTSHEMLEIPYKQNVSFVWLFETPWNVVHQPARLLCPWGFPRQEFWSGCHALLQGIFPIQGWNPGLSNCRQLLYHLSHREALILTKDISIPFVFSQSEYKDISIKYWQALIFKCPVSILTMLFPVISWVKRMRSEYFPPPGN